MFSKKTTAALFAIAIASSLIVASGFLGLAFAAKKGKDSVTNTMTNSDGGDSPVSLKSQSPNTSDSSGKTDAAATTGGGISTKDLKTFSKCVAGAAIDGDLRLSDVNNCYGQVFDHGLGQGTDQSSSTRGSDLTNTG